MEFKFSAQHYTVIYRYSCKLTHLSHLLHLVPTIVICDWPETRWALEARCCPETNRKETSVHAVHAVHDRSALGTGLRPFHGTGNCHERHENTALPWATSPIFAFWFQTCFLHFLTSPVFGMHRGGWCDVSISPVWMGKTTLMEEYVCYTRTYW